MATNRVGRKCQVQSSRFTPLGCGELELLTLPRSSKFRFKVQALNFIPDGQHSWAIFWPQDAKRLDDKSGLSPGTDLSRAPSKRKYRVIIGQLSCGADPVARPHSVVAPLALARFVNSSPKHSAGSDLGPGCTNPRPIIGALICPV